MKKFLKQFLYMHLTNKMTKEEFSNIIKEAANNRPKNWRYGQAVFNYTSELFGVARKVQMIDHIDCFYNDDMVDSFIEKAYSRYNG